MKNRNKSQGNLPKLRQAKKKKRRYTPINMERKD